MMMMLKLIDPVRLRLTALTIGSSSSNSRSYTIVVDRVVPTPKNWIGDDPRKMKLRPKNMQYKLVDANHCKKWGNVELILTDFVEGVGRKGELVNVSRHMAYYELLPSGVAVYPTDEYMEMYRKDRESYSDKVKISPFSFKTREKLSSMILKIPMNPNAAWTLNRDHVRLALRFNKIFSKSENIKIPKDLVITNETWKNLKEPFTVEIQINDYTSANLKCVITAVDPNILWENFAIFQKTV